MWGNTLGWIIAVFVLALEAGGVWLVARMDRISPTTEFSANNEYLAPLELPFSPTALLPQMTRDEDAGAIYREIIEIVQKDLETYESFVERGKVAQAEKLGALARLKDAANCTRAAIFIHEPESLIHFGNESPRLECLRLAGRSATRAALLMKDSNAAEAQKLAEAVFALACRLFEERLTIGELRLGIELMGESAALLARLANARGESAEESMWKAAGDSIASYYKSRIDPISRVLMSVDPNVIGAHTGDYFYFAHHAQEKVWRVEAIRAIGRLQYYVGEGGRGADQTGAKRELKQLAADPDPLIRTAAIAARDLTVEQYRMMR